MSCPVSPYGLPDIPVLFSSGSPNQESGGVEQPLEFPLRLAGPPHKVGTKYYLYVIGLANSSIKILDNIARRGRLTRDANIRLYRVSAMDLRRIKEYAALNFEHEKGMTLLCKQRSGGNIITLP